MCATHSTKTKKGHRYTYDYYTCSHRNRYGAEACANAFRPKAQALEELVRRGVFAYIEDPKRLRADLEYAIDLMRQEETRSDPEREAKRWAGKLAEVDRKRARYQEMAAEELITLDELRARLAELGEMRETAERELAALRDRAERIQELERDAEAILESYARLTLSWHLRGARLRGSRPLPVAERRTLANRGRLVGAVRPRRGGPRRSLPEPGARRLGRAPPAHGA
jgi:hypothetical protein